MLLYLLFETVLRFTSVPCCSSCKHGECFHTQGQSRERKQASGCASSSLTFHAVLLCAVLIDRLLAAGKPWSVPEHLRAASQCHEVPAKLLPQGAAHKALLPVPSKCTIFLLDNIHFLSSPGVHRHGSLEAPWHHTCAEFCHTGHIVHMLLCSQTLCFCICITSAAVLVLCPTGPPLQGGQPQAAHHPAHTAD